jgi:hypothetical protein
MSWKHTTFTALLLKRSTVIRPPHLGGDDDDPYSTGHPYSMCNLITPPIPVYGPFMLMNCIFSFPFISLSSPYPPSAHSDSCTLTLC